MKETLSKSEGIRGRYVALQFFVLFQCIAVFQTPFAFAEAQADGFPHSRLFSRHVRLLTVDWVPLRVSFVTPPPPVTLTGNVLPSTDLRACTEIGQYVATGSITDAVKNDTVCSTDLRTNCWRECTNEHLITVNRSKNLATSLQICGGKLERSLEVLPEREYLSFGAKPCGFFNVTGYFVSTLVVVVTTRPTFAPLLYDVTISPCEIDSSTMRPTLVHVNVAPQLLDNPTESENTLLRAVLQAMALNIPAMAHAMYPLTSQTYFEYDNESYPTGPFKGFNVSMVNFTIVFPQPPIPGNKILLNTPTILSVAREYFGCSSLEGLETEDIGYSDGLIFFEKRLLRTELLTVEPIPTTTTLHLSKFSLALLKDTGWFLPKMEAADERMGWGKGQGCQFTNVNCAAGGWSTSYFCIVVGTSQTPLCTFDRRATGRCNLVQLNKDIPEAYRLFSNTLMWGSSDEFTDRCPYVAPDTLGNGNGDCTDAVAHASLSISSKEAVGGGFGEDSRCFGTALARADGSSSAVRQSTCHDVACVFDYSTDSYVMHTRVGRQFVPCGLGENYTFVSARSDMNVFNSVESDAYNGNIQCGGAIDVVCSSAIQKPWWPSVTRVEPPMGSSNGGMIVTIFGENLIQCHDAKIGGVFLENVVYNYPTRTLRGKTNYIPPFLGSVQPDGLGLTDVEIWCNVSDVCPEGCGVARLKKGYNLTELLPCNFTRDITVCTKQPMCVWDQGKCIDFVATTLLTTAPSATTASQKPHDTKCTPQYPHYCPETNKCTLSESLCLRCGDSMTQCWNSECRNGFTECDCHPSFPFRCPVSLQCTKDEADCYWICPEGQVKCWDQSCANKISNCPCPPEMSIQCNFTGNCVQFASQCSSGEPCPLDRRHRCWDELCVERLQDCRCPVDEPIRCWNLFCAKTADLCDCPPETPFFCQRTKQCTTGRFACNYPNVTLPPCAVDEFRCQTNDCAAHQYDCPCEARKWTLPTLQIHFTDKEVDWSLWTRIPAEGRLVTCDFDLSASLVYQWSIVEDGSMAPVMIRGALLVCRVLEIPPFTLIPGRQYTIHLNATAPIVGVTTRSVVHINVTVPRPSVRIFGGNRDVSSSGTLYLSAIVHDADVSKSIVKWRCCPYSKENDWCAGDDAPCPALLSVIEGLHSEVVSIRQPPAGIYIFSVHYKDAMASATISVKSGNVPVCYIYVADAVLYSHMPITLHSVVAFSTLITQKWAINNTILAGAIASSLTLPSFVLPAESISIISTIITTLADEVSECQLQVRPRAPPPHGRCHLRNNDPRDGELFRSNVGTAGYSMMELDAYGWGSDPLLVFRFGFIDATGRQLLLSSSWTAVPRQYFTAPLLLGNPSLLSVRFFVQVSVSDTSAVVVRNATCNGNLRAVQNQATPSLLEALAYEVRLAANTSDMPTLLQQSSRLASMLADIDLADTRRYYLASLLIQCLHDVLVGRSDFALSMTSRSLIVGIVEAVLPFLDALKHQQLVSQLCLLILQPRDGVTFDAVRDEHAILQIISWAHSSGDSLVTIEYGKSIASVLQINSIARREIASAKVVLVVWRLLARELPQKQLAVGTSTITNPASMFFGEETSIDVAQMIAIEFPFAPSNTTFGITAPDVISVQNTEQPDINSTIAPSYHIAQRVSNVFWLGVRHEQAEDSAAAPLLQAISISLRIVVQDGGENLGPSQRNLTCFLLNTTSDTWQRTGDAVVPLQATQQSTESSTYVDDVTCTSHALGFIAVFDESQFAPVTVPPTTEAPTSLFSTLTSLRAKLPSGAVAAIVVGGVAVLACFAYFWYYRRDAARAAEVERETKEKSEILLVAELLQSDPELRIALDISKIRQKYTNII